MVSNAYGFSWPPRAWHAPGWGYTCCLEPETVLSLSQRHLGLMRGEGHVVFRHMVLLALLLGRPRQGCQRRPPFCIPLCEVVQREGSEVLGVDKGSKMELTGAQEMLSLFPCLEGTTDQG